MLKISQKFWLVLLVIGLIIFGLEELLPVKSVPNLQVPAQLTLAQNPLVPVYIGDQSIDQTFPTATASAMYIMDRQSGSILYQRAADVPHPPASTAKMMTALLVRKLYPLDQVMQVKQEAFALGSAAHLRLGEQLTVQNLLYALLLPSGNDAAFLFADHHPFGYAGFVRDMNQMAQDLHLDQTHFANPSGLDVDGQVSTARDLAILANEVMKDDVLRQVVGTQRITITDVTGQIKHPLTTTQELLGVIPGVVGVKTGTTAAAGENLVTEVDREGHAILIVLLGSQNRYNETTAIIQWVFTQYQWQTIRGPQ